MRKLATIRRIAKIIPIPEADRIEVARVDGWNVIVKKNEFQEGDLVVYFEIDSWIPRDIAPFLTKEGKTPHVYKNVVGERLKTAKMRGVVSQGLILPISILPNDVDLIVGVDVSELLNIKKWELPEVGNWQPSPGIKRKPFPTSIPKTDQERIQNIPEDIFQGYRSYSWEVTEKLDGTSMTVWFENPETVHICTRNTELELNPESDNSVYHNVLLFSGFLNIVKDLRYGYNLAFQGELCGPNIQGNPYKLSHLKWFIYSIYNADSLSYIQPADARNIMREIINYTPMCAKQYIGHVPVINVSGTVDTIDNLISMADGKSVLNPEKNREGLVFKCNERPVSFKAISNKYLLEGA